MNESQWVQRILDAVSEGVAKPVCASEVDNADLPMAYRVQAACVAEWHKYQPIAGFKGALTSSAAQKIIGLPNPASGVLLGSMWHDPAEKINRSSFSRLVLETEIGFCIGKTIEQPVTDNSLADYIEYCLPMIELASLGVDKPAELTALDFVACNASAAGYLPGQPSDIVVASESLNGVQVKFSRDEEVLHTGTGADALGDQITAAIWLVNQLVAQGYVLQPGQLLMTGSLGNIQMTNDPGQYVADYGDFGRISFTLE